MVLSWWRRRRRRQIISRTFPREWQAVLENNVCICALLEPREQDRLQDYIKVFVAEKNWEGCGGLTMNDEIKVTVASQIALLVLGFSRQEYFENVLSILVYPQAFVAAGHTMTSAGVVLERDAPREGEAWYRGPVILSWPDVLESSRDPDAVDNLVLHEFAHQLDMLNGRHVDGVPPQETYQQHQRWSRMITEGHRQLVRNCRQGQYNVLDCYGATNMAEFFAVATETFFQRPREMRIQHGEMYELFRQYYGQDPSLRRGH